LGLSVLLLAFRTAPAALLERDLRYDYVANVEFAGTLLFHITAVTLAAAGARAWSFVIATLVNSAALVLLTLRGTRWRPRLRLDRRVIGAAIAFGAPWQLHRWVNVAKDNIVPTLIAARFGPQAVGYLTLASTTAFRPLQLLPVLDRVTFSAYARLRED